MDVSCCGVMTEESVRNSSSCLWSVYIRHPDVGRIQRRKPEEGEFTVLMVRKARFVKAIEASLAILPQIVHRLGSIVT